MLVVFDALALVSALTAAWLWYLASGRTLRRVSREENIDAADLNRIIIAINRAQLLNGRAALATAISGFVLALRLGIDLLTRG